MDELDNIIEEYEIFINPAELYSDTTPEELFNAWKDIESTVEDLESALSAFEKEEMYEHCSVINQLIVLKNRS